VYGPHKTDSLRQGVVANQFIQGVVTNQFIQGVVTNQFIQGVVATATEQSQTSYRRRDQSGMLRLNIYIYACLNNSCCITLYTSDASIAYRKQLHPQRTVGIIGSVWQESTPSKETTGPAQTNTQSTKNHQEGHPLDSDQLTTCEGSPTKTWRLDSPWWCVAERRTE